MTDDVWSCSALLIDFGDLERTRAEGRASASGREELCRSDESDRRSVYRRQTTFSGQLLSTDESVQGKTPSAERERGFKLRAAAEGAANIGYVVARSVKMAHSVRLGHKVHRFAALKYKILKNIRVSVCREIIYVIEQNL